MGKTNDEINRCLIEWDNEYKKYEVEAKGIVYVTNENVIRKINDEVQSINNFKMELKNNIETIYYFLKKFGNPEDKVTLSDYKNESSIQIVAEDLVDSEKPENNFKFGKRKDGLINIDAAFKYKMKECDHDKTYKKSIQNKYEKYLKIVELYREVFAAIVDTINNTVLPELPGIESYLYARGVKDAFVDGYELKTAKPTRITTLKSSKSEAIRRHYIFFQNTHDLYTLTEKMYKTDVLGNLFKGKEEADDIERKINGFKSKKEDCEVKLIENSFYSLEA